ncbi:insulinase family protein [bacterium]|jgi:predicted Zn-dependent peptidase|nr:insulinase family protein [bacterium]
MNNKIKITKLSNGIRIVTTEMKHMHSVSMGIWVATGGRYEAERQSGISHFLEHLLFKGTTHRTCRKISEAIEGVGGILNAYTSEEYTFYMAKVSSKYFHTASEILFDIYINSIFDPREIERERGVIKEEINMYHDMPDQHIHDLIKSIIWEGHPLGKPLIGSVDTVSSITRDDILRYMNANYTTSNTVISVAGNIKHDTVVKESEKWVRNLPGKPAPGFLGYEQKPLNRRNIFLNKKTEQVHLALGVKTVERGHKDKYAFNILSVILGENMSSRLFQSIREKYGLSYNISSAVEYYKDSGCFTISGGFDAGRVEQAVSLIMRELNKIRSSKVSSEEIERAKEYYIGQFMLAMERTTSQMYRAGESLILLDRIIPYDEVIAKVQSVAAADIRRIAADYFTPENIGISGIGLIDKPSKIEKILKKL